MDNIEISLYSGVTDKKGVSVTLVKQLEWIQMGKCSYDKTIQKLRDTQDKATRDRLKKKLLAVTWSGTFKERRADALEQYSGVICIDIDNIPDDRLLELKKKFAESHRTFAVFISPSGNGLKVLYKTNTKPEQHQQIFKALEFWLRTDWDVEIDPSGKDVSRLCFLSYDPDIYVNHDCQPLNSSWLQLGERKVVKPAASTATVADTIDSQLDEIAKFTNNKATYVEGERNNYIHLFASNANRAGISHHDTLSYCLAYFTDLERKEIESTVKSAYSATAEHGKYARNTESNKFPREKSPNNRPAAPAAASVDAGQFNTEILFWYEEENEKTGKTSIKFSYDKGIKFLENNGFYKIPMDNNNYQFIRVQDNIVEIVKDRNMREFKLEFLKTEPYEYAAVREMYRRGTKMYASIYYFEGLEFYRPNFKADTEKEAYVYFKNCWLKITAEKIERKPYSELSGNIWRKQIIDFELADTEYSNCYYDAFLQCAILGRNVVNNPEMTDDELAKMKSVMSTIGYLLHQYKDPANPKCVIGVDQKLRDGKEHNGGTGKSLFAKAISHIINTFTIDGKNFKWENQWAFERLNIDHRLINFNDVKKNFDFELLFGLLTEDFTYSKKYIESVSMPFDKSPKMYISTNTTIKGAGSSMERRQHIIEFSSYFNKNRTPQSEFGHLFFNHWDQAEYTQFYLFMINNIRFYLQHGLLEFPLENYGLNKLIDTAGEEFIDYMNETVLDHIAHQQEHEVKTMFEGYLQAVRGTYREKTAQNTFSKNVRQWCELNKLQINAHKNGERDRRNGKDYYTFTRVIEID